MYIYVNCTHAPDETQRDAAGGKAAQERAEHHKGAHKDLHHNGDVLEGARRRAVQLEDRQCN